MGKKAKPSSKKKPKASKPSSLVDTRVIYCGDNLDQLKKLPDNCVDLIYIDPPFNSNRNYEVFWGETREKRSFEDRHASTQAYIDFMRPRCVELHRVLKKTGSFYYHCDWHASHYVKVMLDQIFGENQFQNEIIWQRTTAGKPIYRNLPKNADSILWFTKSNQYIFTPIMQPLTEDDKATFASDDGDGRGPYNTQPIINPGDRPNLKYTYTDLKGRKWPSPKTGWRFSEERMRQAESENRLVFGQKTIREKYYLSEREAKGKQLSNIWTDIPIVSGEEKLGYPTQKPLALLDRIIKASSNENDIVLDAFCGCGTALVAAENLGRQWIGIDVSPTACKVMAKRLRDVCKMRQDEALWRAGRGFIVRDLPWTKEKLREIPPFEFENWAVYSLGGIPNKTKVGDMGIDGRIFLVSATPKKKEGHLDFMDDWYPIQVKQKDKVGRPDIDAFEAVMMREDRRKGFFVSFGYSADATREIGAFFKRTGKTIIALTVKEILDEQIAMKLA
ncbi:MAG: restriction endonuclease [Sedimentisphaerales bacterium]|nr:restriction endonuclease [Sedimentisphaerales bacterium]